MALAEAYSVVPRPHYARETILEHIDDLEDPYPSEQRLAEIHGVRIRIIPFEVIMKDYGMEN